MRRLVHHVGMTVDGMIAGPGGSVDFFPVTPGVIAVLSYAGK